MRDHFAQRFTLALKALSMSRARLASELGVDKSVVARWSSGAVQPSNHNLERLTRLLAAKSPGFTLLDWDRDLSAFAALFGVELATDPSTDPSNQGLDGVVRHILRDAVDGRLDAYEGFWRTTHASFFEPGRFCHQYGIIRRDRQGLVFDLGAEGVRYSGTMTPVEGQVFGVATDNVRQVPAFLILNVVAAPRITLLDGILLAASNSMRIPASYSVIWERIGDLTGVVDADDRHAADLMRRPEVLETPDEIPEVIRRHLLRDFGPAAASAGGELMLSAPLTRQLAGILALGGRPSAPN